MSQASEEEELSGEPTSGRAAALTLGVGKTLVLIVNFATTAYLLRALGPAPFGLLAMAAALLAFLNSLGDAGVGASLVSDQELSRSRVGAALCVTFGLGGAICLVAIAATPFVVWFSGTEAIVAPWLVISAMVIPGVVGSIPAALAQRDERFALLAWAQGAATIIGSVVGIGLAQVQTDVWPLLARQAAATLTIVIGLWLWVRPRFGRPSRADFAEISRFSLGLVGSQLLHVFHRQGDDVLVGRALGQRALGYYNLCYRVLTLPLVQISGIAGTIAYPRLSRLAPDWRAVTEALAKVLEVVALLTAPFCIGVAVAAPELIVVLFGPVWLPALVPFQVLALLGMWQAPFRLVGYTYIVSRNTTAMTRWGLIATPVYLISFVAGLPWGIAGVAIAYAAANVLLAPFQLRHASQVIEQPTGILARGVFRGLGLGLLAGAPLVVAHEVAVQALELTPIGVLVTTVAAGAAVEAIVLTIVWRSSRGAA